MQILVSCSYMHRKEVVHRDLNPENILVTDVKGNDIFICISGFKNMINIHSPYSNGICGTPGFIAPEILSGCSATDKADIFTIGAVFYQLLSG